MSGRARLVAMAILTGALTGACWCQETPLVSVEVTAEPTSVKLGEVFTLRLQVVAAAVLQLNLPGQDADLAPAEVRAFRVEDEHTDVVIQRMTLVYELQLFELGEQEIKPPPVVYEDQAGHPVEVQPEPVTVTVDSVLLEGAEDIKEIRGPRALRLSLWHYAAIALVALLLAALVAAAIWLLVRRAGRRVSEPQAPPLSAHAEALAALDELQQRELVAQGRLHEHYVQLSYIARRYLQRRYRIEALECTTPMLARRLKRSPAVPGVAEGFIEMLHTADLVKFAKYQPDDRVADLDLHSTRKLVQLTRETEAPEEEAAAQAAAE